MTSRFMYAATLAVMLGSAQAQTSLAERKPVASPPSSPSQLEAYAAALVDTAEFLDTARANRVPCDGAMSWRGRRISVTAKMADTCGPGRSSDTAWQRDQNWVLALPSDVRPYPYPCPDSDGDGMGAHPAQWSGYCTKCPAPYDATSAALRDDAASVRRMASVVACYAGRVPAAEAEARRRQDAERAEARRQEDETRDGKAPRRGGSR